VIASSRKTTCSTQALKNVYSVVGFFQKTDVCSEGYQNFFAWLAIVFASSQKTEADTCSDMLKDVLRLLLIPISSHDQATLLWSALVGMLCIPLWLHPGLQSSCPGQLASSLVSLKTPSNHHQFSSSVYSYNYQFVQEIEITLQVLEVSLVPNFVEIWPVYSRMCKKSTV